MLAKLYRLLGPLRAVLAAITLMLVAAAPFAHGETQYHDWRIVPTVLAPTIMVMLAFVLPLDMLMTRVFLAGAEQAEDRVRLRRVLWVEAGLLALLLAAWSPFLARLVPD